MNNILKQVIGAVAIITTTTTVCSIHFKSSMNDQLRTSDLTVNKEQLSDLLQELKKVEKKEATLKASAEAYTNAKNGIIEKIGDTKRKIKEIEKALRYLQNAGK